MNTEELRGKAQDWQRKARETAKNFGESTDSFVRENTWSTLALAAVLGCLVGYLLTTSRD
jgi:ElaB/YqjD/DUF883 family membrane-anchored ribosome-binding protein